jgi:hypothetical protein
MSRGFKIPTKVYVKIKVSGFGGLGFWEVYDSGLRV